MSTESQPSVLHALWNHKLVVIVVALAVGVVAYGVSMLVPTKFEAGSTVYLDDPKNSGGITTELGFATDLVRHLTSQADLIESSPVAQRAAEILADGTTTAAIDEAVAAEPVAGTSSIEVRVVMPTAERAVATQDAVIAAYEQIVTIDVAESTAAVLAVLDESVKEAEAQIVELDGLIAEDPTDSVLEARRTASMGQLVALDTRAEQLTLGAALYGSGVRLYVPDEAPTDPFQPNPLRNAGIAFLLAGLGASVWAWWSESE